MLWSKKEIELLKEAEQPTICFISPKKKRNESEWKRNIKKKISDSGEKYSSFKEEAKPSERSILLERKI